LFPRAFKAGYQQGGRKISTKIPERSGGESIMEYKGYFAKVEFDDEANIFHGALCNIQLILRNFVHQCRKLLNEYPVQFVCDSGAHFSGVPFQGVQPGCPPNV